MQEAKARWAQTLWVDLNILLLQDGIAGFLKRLKQLPKDTRALPVNFFLDARLKEFKESLPLLLDLKNEALRDRSGTCISYTVVLKSIHTLGNFCDFLFL